MNKILLVLRRKLLLFFLLFLAIIYGCRKEISNAVSEQVMPITESKLISDAKLFFESQIANPDTALKKTSSINSFPLKNFLKSINWSSAYSQSSTIGKIVVLPVQFAERRFVNLDGQDIQLNTITRLFIYKNKKDVMKAELVIRIPDSTYLKNQKTDKKFSGVINVFDWYGNYIKGYRVENGVTKKLGLPEYSLLLNNSNQINKVKVNTVVCKVTTYGTCVSTDNGETWYCHTEGQSVQCDGNGDNNTDSDPDPTDYSGGGSSGTGSTPDSPAATPCSKAKVLSTNASFVSSLKNLKDGLVQSYESAYKFGSDGSPTFINGGANGSLFNFTESYFSNSKGFIHNHENNAGNLSIFSGDDFRTMFMAVQAANPADRENYTFGVVTSSGSYILAINDLTKFMAFKDQYYSPENPSQFNAMQILYNNFVNTSKSASDNEVGLMQFMGLITGGTGLTLMKGDESNPPKWRLESNNNGTPIYSDCN